MSIEHVLGARIVVCAGSGGVGRTTGVGRRRPRAGPLHAMMLDTKRTFDELVIWSAKGPDQAERMLGNGLHEATSGALSGTHGYTAMEKPCELDLEGAPDRIVIDTPPTCSALVFLEPPARVVVFEGKLLKWFVIPAIGGG